MLVSLKEYQHSRRKKRAELDGTIALLENTSKMIDIFSDMTPICGSDDVRLSELRKVAAWFQEWETAINTCSTMSQTEKTAAMLTKETLDDTFSVLLGFTQMCENHFKHSSVPIVPGRMNSDIYENVLT